MFQLLSQTGARKSKGQQAVELWQTQAGVWIFFRDYRDLTAKSANDSQVPECKCFVFYALNRAAK